MAKNKKEEVQSVIPKEEVNPTVISSKDVGGKVDKVSPQQIKKAVDLEKEQPVKPIEDNNQSNQQTNPSKVEQPLVVDKEEKSKNDAILLEQKKAEEEKLRQQQLAQQQQILEEKKQEQQDLETKRREEQELLKKQEEEKKKLEQQKLINQGSFASSNTTAAVQPNTVVSNSQLGVPNSTLLNEQTISNNPNLGTNLSSANSVSNNNQNEKGGPSTFKRIMAAILFISLMVMVYFLPEITNYINDMKERNNQEKITSGVMECSLKKSNETLDIDINSLFYFTNNQLYKMEYTTIHTGDKLDDKEELENLYNECLLLKQEAGNLDGVVISCSLNNGINSNKQILDYEKLDLKEVTSAYTEAGGVYPAEFKKSEDIDKIESEMTTNKYTCKRR